MLLVELVADDDDQLAERERAALELLAGHRLLEPAEFTRDRERTELYWKIREGMFGIVGTLRPHGTLADHRRRLRAAGARRRGGQGHPGAARQARFPHRRCGPCVGRQPALHADARHEQAGGPRTLRGVHGRARGADRREVRRLAEGRARHRPQHGALCRTRVGGARDRDDVARQAAGRSARRARAGRRAEPRSRRPHARPQDDAADRAGRRRLHRVRSVRAGVPEPRPDDDAAPADRAAPRDGAPAGRLAAPAGAARAVRIRRGRDLRRRWNVPDCLPGADRHRQAHEGLPRRASTVAAPSAWRCGRPTAGPPSSALPAGACAPATALRHWSATHRCAAPPRC